jgi:phosphoribosylglycinamide formyltransferase 1
VRKKLRIAVLVSGSGSNLQALIDAGREPAFPAEVAVVLSNVPGALALERARSAGIPTVVMDHKLYSTREAYEEALISALRPMDVGLVCLAGFMRILTGHFLQAFPGQVINIHPALLPAFPGMHAVRQALEYGVKVTGCTVHLVDAGTDTGPIIAQVAVPVLAGDDEKTLGSRVQEQEHALYPAVVRLFGEQRVTIEGRRVKVLDRSP